MRTSTMNMVNGPVSAIWAPSHNSKSLFKAGLELDQRRRRHVALERLQERVAPVGFVPGLEGTKFHQRVQRGIWRGIAAGSEITFDQRMQIRLVSTWAINQAEEIARTAYGAAGSTAVFQNQAFERRFRDIHAVTQQVQGRPVHFETVGAYILGLDTDSPFV